MKQIINTLANSDFISKCTNYIIIHKVITCQLFPTDNLFAADLSTGDLEMSIQGNRFFFAAELST